MMHNATAMTESLQSVAPPGLQRNVPLAPLTTLGIGGPATDFVRAETVDEIREVIAWAEARRAPLFILGGGSPKNFALQTEPQIQEVLGIDEKGHDYFLQVTDARPDTGGLSGATPAEAVSWGKVDPEKLPDAVVAYVDSTVALPLITAYALARHAPRKPRRLYDRRDEFMRLLTSEYERSTRR